MPVPPAVRHCLPAFWLTIFSFFLIAPAAAQDASTGSIRGPVSDPNGARIAGAHVLAVNSATGLTYTAATNSEGAFAFDLLPPGDYGVRADASGMRSELRPAQHVPVGGSVQLDFRLVMAVVNEAVTVTEPPSLVEIQSSAVSGVIDEKAISDVPLNGRRFSDPALLDGGVTQDPRSLTSASNGDLAYGGIRGTQTSFLVDGADNNNGFFAQARGRYRAPYQFSNEVVKEFRVSSNSYGAELGRAGGAVVNVVTKSGSNRFHGTAFYYLRDSQFNAQPAFVGFKPYDRQQQFGFTLGGPLRRNRVSSMVASTSTFSMCPRWCSLWAADIRWSRNPATIPSSRQTMKPTTKRWCLLRRTGSRSSPASIPPSFLVMPASSKWISRSARGIL